MKWIGLFLLLGSSGLCQQPCPASAAGQGFTIAGTVLQNKSSQPLSRVLVSIAPIEHRDHRLACVTGGDGRFLFSNLANGKYDLQAERNGYQLQAYGANDAFSTAIAAGPNIDSEHVVFPLHGSASISVAVTDEEGEPINPAIVYLFYQGIVFGKATVSIKGQGVTNGSGRYSFGKLQPGTYFVGVTARPWFASNDHSDRDLAYPVTYYADATEPAAASPITVEEGSSASIRIALRAVPALHLQIEDTDPRPGQSVAINVFQAGPGGVPLPVNAVLHPVDNRQDLEGLASGRYLLAMQTIGQGKIEFSGRRVIELTGDTTIDASAVSKISVSGRLKVEGAEQPKQPVVLWFRSLDGIANAQPTVAADGSFRVDDNNLMSTKYEIGLPNAPGFYIRSVVATGAKYSSGTLDLTESAAAQLSIVISKGVTRMDGVAIQDDKPLAGAMVLLLPQDSEDSAQSRSYIGRDQSDSDGTFSIRDVPPGRYTLLAIDDGRDLAYQDASVMKPYVEQGQAIDISAAAQVKVNVQKRLR
jgi:hypothetical protein